MKKVMEKQNLTAKELAEKIAGVLSAHKGEDIIDISLQEKTCIADYFVIASGRSSTHCRSLIEHVEEEMEKIGYCPIREEGTKEGRWAVIDFGDVIVHVFNDETRLMYHLEKLWGSEENITRYE